jgi:4-hydroxybenzoate polyprenyltransferase
VASGLTAAGVGIAAVAAGPRAAAVAGLLAGAVWAYDLSGKAGPVSTGLMAGTRGLDVLLGASSGGVPGLRRAALPAALLGVHTAGVTALSRGEVHGTSAGTARAATAVTVTVASLVPLLTAARAGSAHGTASTSGRGAGWLSAVVAAGASAAYGSSVGRAQARAVTDPAAPVARAATVAGIRGMVPLQGGLIAASGEAGAALAFGAASFAARSLSRWGTPT